MTLHSSFLDSLGPSAIRAITARIRDKKREGVSIVNFAGGMPDENTFPSEEFAVITAEIIAQEGGAALQYAASDGYDPLRKSIAELMKAFDVDTDFRNIMISSGSQQALSYISRALLTEDSVVFCEAPTYVGALDTFRVCTSNIVGIAMDDDGLCIEELEDKLKETSPAFIYCIPDFQNPTGRCMSIERRKKIVELAEKYDTYIIEDAPYSLITFKENVLPAIKSFDKSGRVIYLGSFSKTICPGIRVGWIVADSDTIRQLVYLKMRDDLQVSNLSQRQVARYLTEYDFFAHLEDIRKKYKERRDCIVQEVNKSFPANTHITIPEGGIFLWIELPSNMVAKKVFDEVFKKGLAFVPGEYFFPDSSGHNTMRLNFCTNDVDIIRKKIPEMGSIICCLAERMG